MQTRKKSHATEEKKKTKPSAQEPSIATSKFGFPLKPNAGSQAN